MSEKKKQIGLCSVVIVAAIILAVVVTWTGCKKQPAEQNQDGSNQTQTEHQNQGPPPSQALVNNTNEPAKTDPKPGPTRKLSLNDIIRARKYWNTVYTSWYGKTTPDFTLTDIKGKQHKLSDYRGKNVILNFWAIRCPYCRMGIPHLNALRNLVDEGKLAILAIANEDLALMREYVAYQKMNYTVLVDKGNMPPPYGVMRLYRTTGVPCTFFINPEGKIKLAATGLLSWGEMKAILQAE